MRKLLEPFCQRGYVAAALASALAPAGEDTFPMKVRRQSPASSLPEPYLRFSRIRLSTG